MLVVMAPKKDMILSIQTWMAKRFCGNSSLWPLVFMDSFYLKHLLIFSYDQVYTVTHIVSRFVEFVVKQK